MRLTKIVCTLGPSSRSPEQIRALADAGMNVARINFSHGSHKDHEPTIDLVQKLNAEGYCIPLLLDTKGAEIRTGVVDTPIVIQKGQEVVFAFTKPEGETRQIVMVNYDGFAHDVRGAERILLDNGELTFELVSVEKDGRVIAQAKDDGQIGSRRHVNLPGADIGLPSITDSDWKDLEFGIQKGMDFVALSFIRTAEDVRNVRNFLNEKKSTMQIIAKIETKSAVDDIAEIIEESDGIMVARGDLGADLPFEDIPVIQDDIVARCIDAGKPVIVATHMLESMIQHPMPTRAEVTDVAHAAMTASDTTMLSGETASGQYPVGSVEAMDKILRATEVYRSRLSPEFPSAIHDESEARGEAAVSLAKSTNAAAIVVLTKTGKSARSVTKFRPSIPVFSCTDEDYVQRRLQILHGTVPRLISFKGDAVESALSALKKEKAIPKGSSLVVVSSIQAGTEQIGTVQVREL